MKKGGGKLQGPVEREWRVIIFHRKSLHNAHHHFKMPQFKNNPVLTGISRLNKGA